MIVAGSPDHSVDSPSVLASFVMARKGFASDTGHRFHLIIKVNILRGYVLIFNGTYNRNL